MPVETIKSWFRKKDQPNDEPIIFGRFAETYKSADRYQSWDRSLFCFEQQDYLASFSHFLDYLNNEEKNNIFYKIHEGVLHFEFFQGSKKIQGKADGEHFIAEAKIAKTERLHVGFLRRLINNNFGLKYTRYALDPEETITIVFDTLLIDASPYKLYHGLKEMSVHADKLDDILIEEYEDLIPINTGHIRAIDETEKRVKYEYLIEEIDKVLRLCKNSNLSEKEHPGAYSYILLNLVYKLDYLIKPEGFIMEKLESSHKLYFSENSQSPIQKNALILETLNEIKARSFEAFSEEIYEVLSSFGTVAPVTDRQISDFIESELNNMVWYQKNGHSAFAIAIPDYIVGYCLFNYGLQGPTRALLHLYLKIREYGFFTKLGMETNLRDDNKINSTQVKRAIRMIEKKYNHLYQKLKVDTRKIVFDDEISFAHSFLKMIQNLAFVRKDNRTVKKS